MCLSCAFGRLVGYASEQSLPMHLQTNAAAWRSSAERSMHSPDVSEAKIDTDAPHCPQQPRPVRPCMSVSDECCMCRWWDLGSSGKPSSQIHTADETAPCDATNSACDIGRGTGRACLNGAVMSLVLKDGMVVVIEADETGTASHHVVASTDAVYLAG